MVKTNNKNLEFEDLPEELKKIILDLEGNYRVIHRESSGIVLNIVLLEGSKEVIYDNYNNDEVNFLKFIFSILRKKKEIHWISFRALLNHFEYYFPSEVEVISIGEPETKKKDKTRGVRGSPPPQSSSFIGEEELGDVVSVRDIPLTRVVGEIEGEIYKKGIYISKHNTEHFKTLTAEFELSNNPEDIEIYNKIEEHFEIDYNRFGWSTPIGKEDQARLKICFTCQMHQKGRFTLFIKKNFLDVEKFFEDYYRIFNFLDYEEHGRVLDLFYLQKENRKAFDYIHLANKVSPKFIIDKDFKGSEVQIEYFTLKSGKKVINVKIDYSDPHEPELEIIGSEAESRNLRDILVNPADTLPTISNIGDWSLEARNTIKDVHSQNEIMSEQLSSNGQSLILLQENVNKLDIKTDIHQVEIRNNLELVKRRFPKLEDKIIDLYEKGSIERSQIRETLAKLIVNLLNLDTNIQGNINSTKKMLERATLDTFSTINQLQQKIETKIDAMKSELGTMIKSEFSNLRKDYSNNLYLVLRAIKRLEKATTQEIISEVKSSLDVSESTIYKYLKTLQKHKLIDKIKSKFTKRGRPANLFTISKKEGDKKDVR